MLLTGVSPARVAKTLSVHRDTVSAAADVAASPTAQAALPSGQLSLTEADALREFEDDERAVAALMTAAGTAFFDHRVAQLRQERIAYQARTEAESTYAEKGSPSSKTVRRGETPQGCRCATCAPPTTTRPPKRW
jgi:ParB family chromosome partitioning protein